MGIVAEPLNGRIEESIGIDRRLEHPLVECHLGRFLPNGATGRRTTTMSIVAGDSSSSSVDGVGHVQGPIDPAQNRADPSDLLMRSSGDAKRAEVVHGIRNILNVISILSELTLLKLPDASPASESIRKIKTVCVDAYSLCDQILDDARLGYKRDDHVDMSTLVMALSPQLTAYVPAESALHFELMEGPQATHASCGEVRNV